MSLDDLYFDESRPVNPWEHWNGDEVNDGNDDADTCARCEVEYTASNIPGMLRCPKCGEFVDVETDEEDEGAWEQSSRHKTRLDREDDDG